jgi:hypothetical protein
MSAFAYFFFDFITVFESFLNEGLFSEFDAIEGLEIDTGLSESFFDG